MAARKRFRTPRYLLITCEGKTEREYFNILLDFFRLPASVNSDVCGQRGQHFALVDNTIIKRDELCDDLGYNKDSIECWAVCDEDQMPCSYSDLLKYANDHKVHLAFSAPQFDMFLLQHFEQSNDTDTSIVFKKLSRYRKEYGSEGDYTESTKADLDWMREAIDQRPKSVDTAIVNSEIRFRTTKRPFFTVQELVKRIKELSDY